MLLPLLATARSDGPEWAAASDPEGCRSCHLSAAQAAAGQPDGAGTAAAPADDALSIEGLPEMPAPGKRYPITLLLQDAALANAGFLLDISAAGEPAGRLEATDERAETDGARARSTWDGQWPIAPGLASWKLIWTAPDPVPAEIRFDLWGNAGNDDLSPLGDRIHHLSLTLPAAH